MKNEIHISVFMLLLACVSPLSQAATPDCAEVYFSPDDFNHVRPLRKPAPEFMKSYSLAKAGSAVEQRNVAVSYDAGYLVAACPEKAHYWYQKAADNGDSVSQNWIAHYEQLKEISDGPEFAHVDQVKPPQALASAATQKTNSGNRQDQGPRSAEEMLAGVVQPPPSPSSDIGKIIKIGNLMGDLIK